jgi:hypothetical protein
MFGERPLPTVDRSLDRKIATDAFGSGCDGRPLGLTAAKLINI